MSTIKEKLQKIADTKAKIKKSLVDQKIDFDEDTKFSDFSDVIDTINSVTYKKEGSRITKAIANKDKKEYFNTDDASNNISTTDIISQKYVYGTTGKIKGIRQNKKYLTKSDHRIQRVWDGYTTTEEITDISNMFSGNTYLYSNLNIFSNCNIDLEKVTKADNLFSGCTNLEYTGSEKDAFNNMYLKNVTSCKNMFYNCPKLRVYAYTFNNRVKEGAFSKLDNENKNLKYFGFSEEQCRNAIQLDYMPEGWSTGYDTVDVYMRIYRNSENIVTLLFTNDKEHDYTEEYGELVTDFENKFIYNYSMNLFNTNFLTSNGTKNIVSKCNFDFKNFRNPTNSFPYINIFDLTNINFDGYVHYVLDRVKNYINWDNTQFPNLYKFDPYLANTEKSINISNINKDARLSFSSPNYSDYSHIEGIGDFNFNKSTSVFKKGSHYNTSLDDYTLNQVMKATCNTKVDDKNIRKIVGLNIDLCNKMANDINTFPYYHAALREEGWTTGYPQIYAKLYDTDEDEIGDTLIFNSTPDFTYEGTLISNFNNYCLKGFSDDTANVQSIYSGHSNFDNNITVKRNIKDLVILNTILPEALGYVCRNFSINSIDFTNIDTTNLKYIGGAFSDCTDLATIDLSKVDFSKVYNMSTIFNSCTNLTNIDFGTLDTNNTQHYYGALSSSFYQCPNLDNETLNRILKLCTIMTKTSPKTLKYIGLSEEQAETCTTLSNWESCEAAGWTTGY